MMLRLHYGLLLLVMLASIYALPNLYGEYPSLTITPLQADQVLDHQQITTMLHNAKLKPQLLIASPSMHKISFTATESQLKAQALLQAQYRVTAGTVSAVPLWLQYCGALPMKLGLDLRGGMHLLLQLEAAHINTQDLEHISKAIKQALRAEHIRYTGNTMQNNSSILSFLDQHELNAATALITKQFPGISWQILANNQLALSLAATYVTHLQDETLTQAITVLRKRVNELGIAEATVQQQGNNKISVDLPGLQDSTEAKRVLGKTASLEFHLVDDSVDASAGVPWGDTLYHVRGQSILLRNQIVLRGSSIMSASFMPHPDDGSPVINIKLNNQDTSLFTSITAANIGKALAVVYIEVKPEHHPDGSITYATTKDIISAPVIQGPLGNSFQITGIRDPQEARELALLLRAGSLPAPVRIIEECQLGPSLGSSNIQRGLISLSLATLVIMCFMLLYYNLMGLIANVALLINLLMLVALLSIFGATLTLPGIAGIVLTMAMALDANVLIFERIREELRRGLSIDVSIKRGYDKACTTIIDANLSTFIVAMVLFGLGSGTVKGVAVTLSIGIVTSMLTAITMSKAMITYYRHRYPNSYWSIGI